MAMLRNVSDTWQTAVVATAGQIVNDETASTPTTNTVFTISGINEVSVRVKALALHTATSIDLYPVVADDGLEYAYLTYIDGSVVKWSVTWDGVRESRKFPAIEIRGKKFKILVGSTGTAGNETIEVDAMFHRYDD